MNIIITILIYSAIITIAVYVTDIIENEFSLKTVRILSFVAGPVMWAIYISYFPIFIYRTIKWNLRRKKIQARVIEPSEDDYDF